MSYILFILVYTIGAVAAFYLLKRGMWYWALLWPMALVGLIAGAIILLISAAASLIILPAIEYYFKHLKPGTVKKMKNHVRE
jgi:hypothetical protein